MKLNITVVYPVSFSFDVPDNFKELSYEEQGEIKDKILDQADNYLVNGPASPIVQSATDSNDNNIDELLD